jgi:MFS family permease
VALAALSGSGGGALLIPLYLGSLGYSVGVVGLMAGLGGIATLLARVPVPKLYQPERARPLLAGLAVAAAATSALQPFMADLAWFAVVMFLNRAVAGMATAIYLARFLDLTAESTDRRKVMGFYGGTQAVGFTAANLFTGLLADWLGYPAGFFYGAILSGVAGILMLGLPVPKRARAARPMGPRPRGPRGWAHAVADPGLWGVLNVSTWNNVFHTVNTAFFPVLGMALGLTVGEIGAVRAVYSAANAVGRPVAGLVMGRFTLRQISYLGMGLQMALYVVLPLVNQVLPLVLLSVVVGTGRAVVVVASSAGLAEEVDETRVSRGVSTATYSTTQDVPHSFAPPVAGLVAAAVGVASMFPLTAVAIMACYVAGDLTVARWRERRLAEVPM